MVAPITLNIRHIRGHTFTVEIDHDAEALGLKLLIWEAQHIPIDQQRLVFGGKELEDDAKLSGMGISDGAQLFLVESDGIDGLVQDGNVSQQGEIQASAVVPPAFAPEAGQQSGSFMVNMPQPDSRNSGYELVSEEESSNERISAAIALSKYVRVYCIFGFILTGLATFDCIWSGVGALMFVAGWVGTRKLNRCLLAFPMIISFLIGFIGTGSLIFHAFKYGLYGGWVWVFIICFLIGVFHVMIFFSISKLMCRIRHLSREEWTKARAKILTSSCCC